MKNKNIIVVVLIFILTMSLWNSYAFASDISSDAKSFLEAGGTTPSSSSKSATQTAIGDIAGLLTGLGIIVAVIVAAILGIKFMLGTVDEKANIKESIIPYVCGCIVIFGALGIWKLIIGVLNNAM